LETRNYAVKDSSPQGTVSKTISKPRTIRMDTSQSRSAPLTRLYSLTYWIARALRTMQAIADTGSLLQWPNVHVRLHV